MTNMNEPLKTAIANRILNDAIAKAEQTYPELAVPRSDSQTNYYSIEATLTVSLDDLSHRLRQPTAIIITALKEHGQSEWTYGSGSVHKRAFIMTIPAEPPDAPPPPDDYITIAVTQGEPGAPSSTEPRSPSTAAPSSGPPPHPARDARTRPPDANTHNPSLNSSSYTRC